VGWERIVEGKLGEGGKEDRGGWERWRRAVRGVRGEAEREGRGVGLGGKVNAGRLSADDDQKGRGDRDITHGR